MKLVVDATGTHIDRTTRGEESWTTPNIPCVDFHVWPFKSLWRWGDWRLSAIVAWWDMVSVFPRALCLTFEALLRQPRYLEANKNTALWLDGFTPGYVPRPVKSSQSFQDVFAGGKIPRFVTGAAYHASHMSPLWQGAFEWTVEIIPPLWPWFTNIDVI